MQVGTLWTLGTETLDALWPRAQPPADLPSATEPPFRPSESPPDGQVRPWEMLYLARQLGLRRLLKAVQRARRVRFVLDATAEELADRAFHSLLERDITFVREGVYPRRLLFQSPVAELVRRVTAAIQEGFEEGSALVSELEHELLFLGGADVVRRMVLPPLKLLNRERPRVLEVGAGSGALLRQLHVVMPKAELHGLELDPRAAQRARQRLGHVPWLSLVVGAADSMLFRDEQFDAVTSVYLLHQMPLEQRRRVVAEMFRVLRPGGRLVLCDWVQAKDRDRHCRHLIDAFPEVPPRRHDPHYSREPLEPLLESEGLRVEESEIFYLAKRVVARKPLPTEVN